MHVKQKAICDGDISSHGLSPELLARRNEMKRQMILERNLNTYVEVYTEHVELVWNAA